MILDTLLSRRSFATLRDKNSWLHDWVGLGNRTSSGERINAANALTISGYFAAIRAISEDVAKLPLILYERFANDDKKRRPDHPLYTILHDRPNDDMTSMSFREMLTQHCLGWGNGCAEIVRDRNAVPTKLLPMLPHRIRFDRDSETGSMVYWYRNNDGSDERRLTSMQVFHVHGLGFDGTQGYSIAHMARESLGLAKAAERSGASLFGNNGRPGGLLKHPASLEGETRKRFLDSWNEFLNGPDGMNRTAVLEDGMEYEAVAVPNKDAQWIESRQFSVVECARWLRVPPHKIGELSRATFSNIEHQSIEYVGDALQPWLVRWEQEIKRKLLRPGERKTLFAEHLVAGLLRGDIRSRYRAHAIGRQWGWRSANDVLRLENENGIGPKGDIYLIPANMIDVESAPDAGDNTDGTDNEQDAEREESMQRALRLVVSEEVRQAIRESDQDAASEDSTITAIGRSHVRPLADAYRKILRIEADRLTHAAKRHDLAKWATEYYTEQQKIVRGALIPAVDTFCDACWSLTVGGSVPEGVQQAIAGHTEQMAKRHCAESLAEIDNGTTTLDTWADRADDIAALEMRDLVALMRGLTGTKESET